VLSPAYPSWQYYPPRNRPPAWVDDIVKTFADSRKRIDSGVVPTKSDQARAAIRDSLVELGFQVEAGKKQSQKIRRPVLFGEYGREERSYEIDAFHPGEGIALEVQAGRGTMGNAVYRDIIQTSLLVDADYLALAVQLTYHYKSGGSVQIAHSYRDTRPLLDAIYASQRLQLPFLGVLLIGY
jgi:hypothetical protein